MNNGYHTLDQESYDNSHQMGNSISAENLDEITKFMNLHAKDVKYVKSFGYTEENMAKKLNQIRGNSNGLYDNHYIVDAYIYPLFIQYHIMIHGKITQGHRSYGTI